MWWIEVAGLHNIPLTSRGAGEMPAETRIASGDGFCRVCIHYLA